MPRLTELKFRHNLNNYLLEFDLDDKAIMEDRISVDILARVVNPYGQECSGLICTDTLISGLFTYGGVHDDETQGTQGI
jgi:hypothetical protein